MSRWSDQFGNHQLHETLETALGWMDVEVEELDSEHEEERRRLRKVLVLISDMVAGLDPEFFPQQIVDQINNHLRQPPFWNHLQEYANSQNVQSLSTANDHVTSQIPLIFQMSGFATNPKSRKVLTAVEKSYGEFCEAIEKQKADFQETIEGQASEITDLEQRSNELSSALDTLRTSTDGQLSAWQTEFTDAQTSRAEEYSAAQIERGREFDDEIRDLKTNSEIERAMTTKKHEEAFRKSYDSFVSNANAKTEDIEKKHQSILDIHELVATDGVAGGYKKNADDEQKAANTWRIVSMCCYGLVLLWVVFKGSLGFVVANGGTLDWPVIVTTISVTAVAFVAAQFASRQSRLHRINEQRMRWFSLEVKAIDPFISSLPIEMQQELKRQLSERLFGQDRVVGEKSGKGLNANSMKDLAESLIEAIKTVGKSG